MVSLGLIGSSVFVTVFVELFIVVLSVVCDVAACGGA